MNESFEPPHKYLSLLATVGGVVSAVAAIAGLEVLSHSLAKSSPSVAEIFPDIALQTSLITADDIKFEQEVERQADACRFDSRKGPNTGLNFEIKSFNSKAMGELRKYGLVLPPGYNNNPHKSYPVVFLLHGGHGDAGGWQACGALTVVLSQLYKTGKFPPAIVITPDGNDQRGSSPYWDPEYFDGPHGRIATLIGSELVQEVKSRYRVQENPQFWAMGGLSSGGWGAFNIGLRYLDNFNTLFSHSGYFTDNSGPENSPMKLVEKLPLQQYPKLRFYLDAGAADQKYLEATEQFHQKLVPLRISHCFYIFPGGHGTNGKSGWSYWHKHLADSLTYVGEQWQSAPEPENSKP